MAHCFASLLSLGCFPKESFLLRNKSGAWRGMIIEFSYSELESATNKFSDSNLIGVGGSSHVYCGHLKNGKVVAVKRMKTGTGSDAESIFLTEVLAQTANISTHEKKRCLQLR